MTKIYVLIALCTCFIFPVCRAEDLLIVADEMPAMQILASHIHVATKLTSKMVNQPELPGSLSSYRAVIIYLHQDIEPSSEQAFIDYAREGGKLILLHHTIGSSKRKNRDWFPFLNITLPLGDLASGGYSYLAPVSFEVVNLAPGNYVTSHKVHYDEKIPFTDPSSGAREIVSSTRFANTEVYLNHQLKGQRTILLGLSYQDRKTGISYMQDTAGWSMKTGKGTVYYFMPGHNAEDINNRAYNQILINAVAVR